MKTKFTPGPWVLDSGDTIRSENTWDPVCDICYIEDFDQKANAHLIAEAPEYYNEVEILLSNSSFVTNFPAEAERLESIQAKVRGEST